MSARHRSRERRRRVWTSPAWRIAAVVLVCAEGSACGPRSAIERRRQRRDRSTSRLWPTRDDRHRRRIARHAWAREPTDRSAGLRRSSRDVTLARRSAVHRASTTRRNHFAFTSRGAIVEDLGTEFGVALIRSADTCARRRHLRRRHARRADDASTTRSASFAPERSACSPPTATRIVSTVSNASELLAWSNGRLVFDDTPMSRVAEEIAPLVRRRRRRRQRARDATRHRRFRRRLD